MITEAYVPTASALPIPQQMVRETTLSSPDLPVDRLTEKEFLTIHAGTVIPGDPPLGLAQDVYVSMDWGKDGVVITSVVLDEDGYGWTYEEAWTDFLSSLRDRRESLEKREARLSADDREVLKLLRVVIQPLS